MTENQQKGYRIIGTIKKVKGFCNAGHKKDDEIELSGHSSGGLCGFFFHDIFPYIIMLQFGGNFPEEWVEDPDKMELVCMDKMNEVTIELKRIRE